ncbi:release factor glutamine methyltransferase [Gemmobacter aquaticus]|uniref:Release factor glutamine methyltransferase n=1 Tax=Gemmobacter aquaticus TaxID=490185 RepID=A0A918DBX9_9RHOB|nr:peptide chain release factor N(5)-glutamine methyltransferase [Gemmobacter aquaticus]GGO25100.1 release factor glutamine methyltransferase [Gemmobacter aquaticus]
MTAPRTIADAFRATSTILASAGVPEPAKDARLLLSHAVGLSSDRLIMAMQEPLPDSAEPRLASMVEARCKRQPISQIIGQRQFWGRDFRVTPDVLDPRPETEVLIAAALSAPFTRVLDLGTGSGAILVTLLSERPSAQGVATDLSPAALAVAQDNAVRLGVAERASFLPGSWFDPVQGMFDLIVSNPPYIAADEIPALSPEVLNWEPHMALTPGGDGLDAYRAITAGAPHYLRPNGRLLMEIGPTQGAAVASLCHAAGLTSPSILQDMDGRDRVVSAVLAV